MAFEVGAIFVPVLPNLSGFGPAITSGIAKAAVGLGVVGAVAGKLAFDFDKAFTKISAISNASAKDIEAWKEQVLALSGETAQAPEELADALFFLASAGLDAAEVMPTLEMAAKASAVGLGETADIASILASALNAYSKSGLTAAQATDTLVAAVREGRAEPEEFAGALGRILPIAAATGVTFDQVTASLAALSNIGLDVNEGVTAMRGVLQAIAAPGSQAAQAMGKLGLSAQELLDAISEDGIIGALRLLDTAAKDQTKTQAAYNGILRQVVPNVRALTGVLGLTGQEAKKVDAIFENVLESTGSLDEAFQTTAESASFQLEKSLNELVVTLTELGAHVLPPAASALGTFATGLQQVTSMLGFGPGLEEVLGRTGELVQAWRDGAITATELDAALQQLSTTTATHIDLGDDFMANLNEAIVAEEREVAIRKSAISGWESYNNVLQAGADAVRETGDASVEASKGVGQLNKVAQGISKSLQAEIPALRQTATTYQETFTLTPAELQKIAASWARIARTIASDLREIAKADLTPSMREAITSLTVEQRHAWVEGNAKQRRAIQDSIKTTFKFEDQMPALARQALTGGQQVGAELAHGMKDGISRGAKAVAAEAAAMVTKAIAAARLAAQAASPSKKMFELGQDLMKGLEMGVGDGLEGVISALAEVDKEWTKAWLRTAKAMQAEGSQIIRQLDRLLQKMDTFRDAIRSSFGQFDLIGGAIGLPDVLKQQQLDVLGEALQAAQGADTVDQALVDSINAQIEALQEAIIVPTAEEFGDFFQGQVDQARQFARALKQLQAAGLSPAVLADIASQGIEALPFAEALLNDPAMLQAFEEAQKAINQIAQNTSGKLVEAAFGPALEKAAARAEEFAERLEDFIKALRADALGREVDEVIAALRRMSNQLGGGGGGGGMGGGGGALDKVAEMLAKPQTVEVAFRPGANQALRQMFLAMVSELGLSRNSL